ncbi:MAG: helix-turn-helix domain-containing protein [Clostridia bacterium]|nr:helix-turn-helix domain-containing protein [Clostridia bacterium]
MRRVPDQVHWQLRDLFFRNSSDGGDSLYPITSGYQTCPPGHTDEMLPYYTMICCVKKGGCTVYDCPLSEISHTAGIEVQPGESFLIPSGKIISYAAFTQEPWINAWIGFSGTDSVRYLAGTPFHGSSVVKTGTVLYDIIRELTDTTCSMQSRTLRYMYASSVLWQIFAELTEQGSASPKAPSINHYTQEALDMICRAYNTFSSSCVSLTISDIANQLCISREYLCALFKADIGKSPSQYLMDYRMEKACSLLRESDYPVHFIAQYLGFYDHAYFAKKFKELKGVSPSHYRSQRT